MADRKGRPGAVPVPEWLTSLLVSLLENAAILPPYKEADFQVPVKIVSMTIWSFLRTTREISQKKEIVRLVKPRTTTDEEFQRYIDQNYPQDLLAPKTLRRCYEEEQSSQSTIDLLYAFTQIQAHQQKERTETEQQLLRIAGLYYEFVTHNSTPGLLQESILEIKTDKTARTRFVDPQFKEAIKYFSTRLIGTTGLLLTHQDVDDVLIFYIYIGAEEKPPFLQGVYLYSSPQGNTVTNLAIFHRMPERQLQLSDDPFLSFEPIRQQHEIRKGFYPELEQTLPDGTGLTIRENIQYFLRYKAITIETLLHDKTKRPFDFTQAQAIAPGPLHQTAKYYNTQTDLIGTYALYFNEHYPAIRDHNGDSPKDAFYSSVGKGKLEIKKHPRTGVLISELIIVKRTHPNGNKELMTYKGYLVNHRLEDSSSLILSVYLQPNNDRYLSLVLTVVNRNTLLGCFNIGYTRPGRYGAGVSVLVRQASGRNFEPTAFLPFDPAFKAANATECSIYNYLSINQRSVVASLPYQSLKSYKDSQYKGSYLLYSSHPFKVGAIHRVAIMINGNGAVRYYEGSSNHYHAGKVEQPNPNSLNIILYNRNNQQQGFFCFRVDNVPPGEKVKQYQKAKNGALIYCGSFAGFSRTGDQLAVGAQVILAFQSDVLDASYASLAGTMMPESPEWSQLDENIRHFFSNEANTRLNYQQNAYWSKDLA